MFSVVLCYNSTFEMREVIGTSQDFIQLGCTSQKEMLSP